MDNYQNIKIIIVHKKTDLDKRLKRLFPQKQLNIHRTADLQEALELFKKQSFDLMIVTDPEFKKEKSKSVELLKHINENSPATQILLLVKPQAIQIAITTLKAGTYHYAKEPVNDKELKLLVQTAIEQRPRYGRNLLLKSEKDKVKFEKLIGRSKPMQKIYRQIRQAAATDMPVLLLGETGTGKDLAAQAIHRNSNRKNGPYIAVNLGALPHELVAGELFGYEKGAFTGANQQRMGKFELAKNGTVFLDEIGTIDEKVQITLLRLIEQKKFHRLGGKQDISTNACLIAASNMDLADAVKHGTFREDLYYRLDVFRIVLPPLRERPGDIPLLVDDFLKKYNQAFQKNILSISPECINLLEAYNWPGNVRELKNVIQRAVLVCRNDVLLPDCLPARFTTEQKNLPSVKFRIGTSLKEVEREMIARTLSAAKNNKKRAARLLGISRRALYTIN